MVTRLVVDVNGFELVIDGRRVGPRRMLQTSDVDLLNAVAGQYVDAVRNGSKNQALLVVGRELYRWLDGDLGQLTRLLDEASPPLIVEVRAPAKPSTAARAMLRAPFELLAAPEGEFLAAEKSKLFAVARRLGQPSTEQAALDEYRLGVAFMASAPGASTNWTSRPRRWPSSTPSGRRASISSSRTPAIPSILACVCPSSAECRWFICPVTGYRAQQAAARLVLEDRSVDLATLTPDQLLDLIADEPPTT
jgi:hypothetical protein